MTAFQAASILQLSVVARSSSDEGKDLQMGTGRWAVEERIITSYVAAVVMAVAVFFAGAAFNTYWHPIAQPEAMPFSLDEALMLLLTALLLVMVVGSLPVLIGLAAFRWARVTHPAWFAAYGAATGLLLAELFRDLDTGFGVPAIAGAVGGLTFRFVLGDPTEATSMADTHREEPTPPAAPRPRLIDHDAQAAYVSDALASDDPALVVLALKEIGVLRRVPVALDENPPLGEILRTGRELGFDLVATKARPVNAPRRAGS